MKLRSLVVYQETPRIHASRGPSLLVLRTSPLRYIPARAGGGFILHGIKLSQAFCDEFLR